MSERATSAERNTQRTLLDRPLNIHVSHNYSPPPCCRCIICAILFAHFVDWASASCTRANQRETGQRRYGKGEPIEGIGSCQHGLVCYGPTKWLTPFNAKNKWQRFNFGHRVYRPFALQTTCSNDQWLLRGNMISVGREARANANGLARISVLYQKGGRSVPTYNRLPQPCAVTSQLSQKQVTREK